jgi:hypothetical protein
VAGGLGALHHAGHHELVAAHAGDRVHVADRAGQALGGGPQQAVAGGVAEGVVHQLEVVDVEVGHQHRAGAAAEPPEVELQALEQQGAVGQAGQGVVGRPVGELGLPGLGGPEPLGEAAHVADRDDHRRPGQGASGGHGETCAGAHADAGGRGHDGERERGRDGDVPAHLAVEVPTTLATPPRCHTGPSADLATT